MPRAEWLGRRAGAAVAAAVILLTAAIPDEASAEGGKAVARLGGGEMDSRLLDGDAIVVFFATWSPRCRDVVERVNEIDATWGRRASVFLVDFQEEAAEVREFLADRSPRVDIYLDREGSLSKRFSITTLPGLLVLRDGAVAFRGRLPADVDTLLRSTFD